MILAVTPTLKKLSELVGQDSSCFEVHLQAGKANTFDILYGNKGITEHYIEQGKSAIVPVHRLSDIVIQSESGTQTLIVSWYTS